MKNMKKGRKDSFIGTIEVTFDGYGFVLAEEKNGLDVFVPANAMGDALHRDRVEVSVRDGRGGKLEGSIIRVVERGLKQLVGRFEVRGKSAIIITDDLRGKKKVIVPAKFEGGARHNEMVIAKIIKFPAGDQPIEAEVTKRLGVRGSDETELAILIAHHDLREEFPEDVKRAGKKAADEFEERCTGKREDLTKLPFITIDGEDAKDFDDAVYAKLNDDGSIRLWVSIADVSNFVWPNSPLDKEAILRGTSVYFPGFAIPMLPEELSSNICSLLPDEDRFCMTAEMTIMKTGDVKNPRFYKSVIKSKYRMTYTEAYTILSGGEGSRELIHEAGADVIESLKTLSLASKALRIKRRARGSIDFDLPEPQIVLDMTGKPENIVKAVRNDAHMLIEDLMIAANEAVATYLTHRGYPCVFRVHDRPDPERLIELKELLKYLGHNVSINKDPEPGVLAKVVKVVEGKPEERLINMLLLRSMARAVYSTQNIGHYGLASKCYCHFTSPIRRYPDLIIHRLLTDALGLGKFNRDRDAKYLHQMTEQSSKLERKATEAERDSHDLFCAVFMRDKIGEEFDGLVSHTAKKGVFVELIEYFVEGLILPEDLPGDRFTFDKKNFSYIGHKSGKSFHIGNKIRVSVKDVSIEDRQVYFEVV